MDLRQPTVGGNGQESRPKLRPQVDDLLRLCFEQAMLKSDVLAPSCGREACLEGLNSAVSEFPIFLLERWFKIHQNEFHHALDI